MSTWAFYPEDQSLAWGQPKAVLVSVACRRSPQPFPGQFLRAPICILTHQSVPTQTTVLSQIPLQDTMSPQLLLRPLESGFQYLSFSEPCF